MAVSCCGERGKNQKGPGGWRTKDQGNQGDCLVVVGSVAYLELKLARHSNPERALPRIELVRSRGEIKEA